MSTGQQQPAGDEAKGIGSSWLAMFLSICSKACTGGLANAAGAFKADGAIGGAFEKDGAIGSVAEKVGGPFSSDGAVGQNFTSGGAIGGTVHDTAESAETSVAKNRVENQEATHAKESA